MQLAVVNTGRSDCISADRTMIDINAVLVAVVNNSVILQPCEHLNSSVAIDLGFRPSRQTACQACSRSLRLGNRDEDHLDDLTASGLESLGAEVWLKHLEEPFHHSRFVRSFSVEGDSCCIWNSIHLT